MGDDRQLHPAGATVLPLATVTDGPSPAASPFDFFILNTDEPDKVASTIAAQPPSRRADIVERIATLRGNTFTAMVVDRLDALGSTDHVPTKKPAAAERHANVASVDGAIDALATVRATILPAYDEAVTGLDAAGAQSLQNAALNAYASAVALRSALRGAASPDAEQLQRLEFAIDAAEAQLSQRLTGRQLHGRAVLPSVAPLVLAGAKDPVAVLRRDAAMTIELIATAQQVVAMVAPDVDRASGPTRADQSTASQAAALVHPFRTRPLSFAFVKALLAERGVWSSIEYVATPQATGLPFGPTLAADDRAAATQAAEFGATDDLRGFDLVRAEELLGANATINAIVGDSIDVLDEGKIQRTRNAKDVLGMIYSADPAARGHVLEALHRRGLLVALLDPLPFGDVERLHDSVPRTASFVRAEMRPYFQDKDRSNHSVSHYLDKVPGGGVLKFGANVATVGFVGEHDSAYGAMRAGNITPGQYDAATDKAVERATVVGAASAVTAGAAGAYVEGWTTTMAAGSTASRYGAAVLVGATAGAAGGLGAQAGSDLVDQQLSSPSDYAVAGGIGGGIGGGLSVVAGLGAHGARYLPPGVQTLAQKIAARFPQHSDIFGTFRELGQGHHAQFRVKVGKLLQLADDLQLQGVRPALATASAGGRPLGLDDDVLLTAKAERPFNAPGGLDGPAPISVLKVERVPEDRISGFGDDAAGGSGSLFDDYGPEASYADDVADWHDTPALGDDVSELGLAEPEIGGRPGRRVRHVDGDAMPDHMAPETGMGTLSDVRLGITREPRHHVLPQEEIEWFQARGFPGRDIDQFTIEIPAVDHDMVHGGNQGLARQHWPEREWNTRLMSTLREREAAKVSELRRQLRSKGLSAERVSELVAKDGKLTRDEILSAARAQMIRFEIGDHAFVPYGAR
jgi:hypothetical protein